MDIVLLICIQLREPLRQDAQRQERHPFDVGNLVFVRLPNVQDANSELWILKSVLHFFNGYLVGVAAGDGWLGSDATELLIVDQFGNGRMLAAERAFRIATQLQLAELHIQSIEKQKATDQRSAPAKCNLQYLRRLDAPYNSRQHA